MRILILNAHRHLVGGVEKYLQAIIPALISRGHAVGLVYEYAFDPAGQGIVPGQSSIPTWCLAQGNLPTILESIAGWKPDVVYSHGLENLESFDLEEALLQAYPSVLYLHNYDRSCATGRKTHSFPQIQSCTRRLGPMCLFLHYPRRCGGLHPGTMWRDFRRHSILNSRLSDYTAILVASAHMYDEIQRHGVPSEDLHMLPLPTTDVIPELIAPRIKMRTGNILFVGRLTDVKGVDYLMESIPKAAEKLGRPLTLTVAGDGPERRKLEQLADRTQTPVEFVGWVDTPDKLNLMRRAELLAVPSLWPEPFGLVGIEAGCVGLPAVGYAVGGIVDWLVPGETGELSPTDPPTVNGLRDAIVRALASEEHYITLSRGAWDCAKRFSTETHLSRLTVILNHVESFAQQSASINI